MLQNKSCGDFNGVNDEQLFTDLTPEQASVVKGGATLQVRYLFANNPPQNDPVIMMGRGTVFSKYNIANNSTTRIFKNISCSGNITLSIWDQDPGSNNDDLIAYVNVDCQTATGVKYLRGGGYTLSYRVT